MIRKNWQDIKSNVAPLFSNHTATPHTYTLIGSGSLFNRIQRALLSRKEDIKTHDINLKDISMDIFDTGRTQIAGCKIIAAFDNDEDTESCKELLKAGGFDNVVSGRTFLDVYSDTKIYADFLLYNELNKDENFIPSEDNMYAIVDEWHGNAGTALNGAYFTQDMWGARKIFGAQPKEHYDVGSSVGGFIANILSFNMKTILIDIRPLETYGTENLTFIQEDATNLSGIEDNSIESLSALCSLEHFGLGRYGDPVDPDAHLKAFKSFQRVVKPGGNLYISMPTYTKCSLKFNAHRIYTPAYVIEQFNEMDLIEFSCTSPRGLIKNASLSGSNGGTGLFHFRKK